MTAEAKRPWLRFYPSDWRGDAKLRMCSLAARGLWIELCSIMHEAEPYGHLRVNGAIPKVPQIAALVGASKSEVVALLRELGEAGVYSKDESEVIFSRRMVRDKSRENQAVARGKLGGNPQLKPEGRPPEKKPPKTEVNPPDKPHMPETRDSEANASAEPRGSAKRMTVYDTGSVLIADAEHVTLDTARTFIAKLCRDHGEELVTAAVDELRGREPPIAQPRGFLTAMLRGKSNVRRDGKGDRMFAGFGAAVSDGAG
jgi:hypothetical protein